MAVGKATAIVEGLRSALDHERGGEIAANLSRIYNYVCFRLQEINLLNDVAICDELTSRLAELRASWAELANGGGAERSHATTAEQGFEASPSASPSDAGLALTI